MGLWHAQLAVLVAAALLSAGSFASAKGRAANPQVAGLCARTPFPKTCTGTAGRFASKHRVIDAVAVLNMQVDAFARRTAQARRHVGKVSRTATPQQRQALSFCDTMYMNTQDTIGAAQRAFTFKDKGTAKIMLQLAVQDFESCDRPFQQARMPNPMAKFDRALNEMAQNCMALANLI